MNGFHMPGHHTGKRIHDEQDLCITKWKINDRVIRAIPLFLISELKGYRDIAILCKMEVIKINKLLCYLFAKYGKVPVESIKCVIASFYDGDEIMAAKDLLFKCSGDLNLDGAPRCVNRRQDDNKSKLDTDALLSLVAFIDERGALDLLPKFVAANLERVPPLQSDNIVRNDKDCSSTHCGDQRTQC